MRSCLRQGASLRGVRSTWRLRRAVVDTIKGTRVGNTHVRRGPKRTAASPRKNANDVYKYIIIYIHTTNDTAKVARRNEEHCKTGVHCLQIDQPYRIFAFFADSDFVFEFLEAKSKSKKKLMV